MNWMRKNSYLFICSTFILISNCTKRNCNFSKEFENKYELQFYLFSENCQDYFLVTNFLKNHNNFIEKVNLKLNEENKTFNQIDEIVFDFSKNCQNGRLLLSNNNAIEIKCLFEVKNINKKEDYRLFKISNVGNYYESQLDLILIASLKKGIIGEFYYTKEGDIDYMIEFKGNMQIKEALKLYYKEGKMQ